MKHECNKERELDLIHSDVKDGRNESKERFDTIDKKLDKLNNFALKATGAGIFAGFIITMAVRIFSGSITKMH